MTDPPPSADHLARVSATPIFYSPAYVGAAREFDTTRKAAWVADALQAHPIAGVSLVEPAPLTAEEISAVHDLEYVDAVRTGHPPDLAASNGLGWDAGVWDAVCASNGGAVAAAFHAWRSRGHAGSLSSGLHYASASHGAGFCTFNGLALAAHAVLAAGAKHVLILDLDAHCGGGTTSMVAAWPNVTHVDVAVASYDSYDPAARQTLHLVSQAEDYLPTIARALNRTSAPCDLVIYNAGMDPHEDCAIGELPGITADTLAERERLVFAWARAQGVPVAFVLAGGYEGSGLSRAALVGLHRLTVAAAALANSGATLTTDRIRDGH